MNFLLIALNSREYLYFAIHAAISIKFHHPDSSIQLLVDEKVSKMMPERFMILFDEITLMNEDHYQRKNFEPGLAKLFMYEYCKGDTTYIDADSLLLAPVQDMGRTLQPQTVRIYPPDSTNWNCIWMKFEQYKETYKIPEDSFHVETQSSFFQFQKNAESAKFFKQAQSNFLTDHNNLWGGSFPDELAFNAAFAQLGIAPKEYQPLYFEGNLYRESDILAAGYIGISLFANRKPQQKRIYELYDRLIIKYSREVLGFGTGYKTDQLMKGKHIEKNRNFIRKQTWRTI